MVAPRTVLFYVAAALLVAALSAGIALVLYRSTSSSPGVEILLPTATPVSDLKVYLSGAVVSPGVYTVKIGDRLEDVLAAAGGATDVAQMDCVNLAVRAQDEDHFHIPGSDEPCQSSASLVAGDADSKVNLNTASVEQLQALPGIGEVKAKAIADYRGKSGPLRSTEDVMEVRGIGLSIYEAIKDLVTVGSDPR